MTPMMHPPSPPPGRAPDRLARGTHWLACGLAFGNLLLVLAALLFGLRLPGKPGWAEAVLVLTTTLVTLTALTRHLPLQNVLLAAGVIGVIGGGIHLVGAVTAIPFGPFVYLDGAGPRLFNKLAWPMPLLWVIVILNSRGVARLMLRPWRKVRNYGFWLIGLTVVLAVLFDVALEPFAAMAKEYWRWQPTRLPLTWGSAPVSNFLGWLLTALLILAFAAPALIDKRQQRSPHRPPDYQPLAVWLLALGLFLAGDVTEKLWLAAAVTGGIGLVVAVFAVRGARW